MPESTETIPESKSLPRPAEPRTVSATTLPPKKKKDNRSKLPQAGWISWWPMAAGVLLGLLAPQLSSVLAASYGPWGMRIVFPLVLLTGLQETGFSDELTRTLPQIMLFLQFPLEGLLTMVTLNRGGKLSSALGQLVFIHGVCVLVLWMVAGNAK
jgi:hypothetical protein